MVRGPGPCCAGMQTQGDAHVWPSQVTTGHAMRSWVMGQRNSGGQSSNTSDEGPVRWSRRACFRRIRHVTYATAPTAANVALATATVIRGTQAIGEGDTPA